MGTLSTFAGRFRELREEYGFKQAEMGEELGVSRGTISFYENTDRTPDIEFAARAAKFFGVSADYLLGLTDIRSVDSDIRAAGDYTGLNDKNLEWLHIWAGYDNLTANCLFGSANFQSALAEWREWRNLTFLSHNAKDSSAAAKLERDADVAWARARRFFDKVMTDEESIIMRVTAENMDELEKAAIEILGLMKKEDS
ncbi:helix-turn-helix domain-containing protein [Acutalibacter intestini]|uniref:helix-turn-helix domain-containing protein n=1 Tax=Acutalibacter intestini TaxID=3093659 RepID=UPI002AC8EBE8|nr:helix-turn-helix transcriptional regulator [Acutalibacter sp. M00204]